MPIEEAQSPKEDTILNLRQKFLDIEHNINMIEILNDLFTPFANENCPEGSIIAELISAQIKTIKETMASLNF